MKNIDWSAIVVCVFIICAFGSCASCHYVDRAYPKKVHCE
jgi:hypothetical protein